MDIKELSRSIARHIMVNCNGKTIAEAAEDVEQIMHAVTFEMVDVPQNATIKLEGPVTVLVLKV